MSQKDNDDKTQNFVPLAVDTEVGHYRIIKKIGAGGMGEVFLAQDTKLDREVALKFLPSHLVADKDVRTRFTREARAAAKLNHPNIVVVHEVSEFNGRPYFAMEHVKGKSLHNFASDKPVSLEKVIELVIQICEGLSEAHSKGIIHRDIKSANIVVDDKGRPRLLDFGLATVRGEEKLTRTGSTIGTIAYMSPEQIAGKEIDARSDIFSLGVVFYELVTGRTPFKRDNSSATMSAIANDEAEPMARYKTGVSEDLERIVAKTLRKDIKSRYQHVDDILADLRNLSLSAKSGGRSNDRKMVAVLPFENLGAADDEYFADGITEEITSRLAVVSGLGVISRTSALRFKGTKKSISEIGHELGVDYILEGTVRWAKGKDGASRVRITPQLIHVADDTHLWAERYDREIDDIFEVQSDIAEKVIAQLNITLLAGEQEAIQARPTDNVNAYDLFLKGKEHYNSPNYSKKDFTTAADFFEKAIKIEPDYALAHVYLGRSYSALYFHGHDRTENRMELANQAIDKALEINSELPEANLAIGELLYHQRKDFDKALEQGYKVVDTIPHEANELIFAILRRKGFTADALQIILKFQESNPGDARATLETGITYALMQNFEKAEEWMDRAIELKPNSYNSYYHRLFLELSRGKIRSCYNMVMNIPSSINAKQMQAIFICLLSSRKYEEALEFVENTPDEIHVDPLEYMPRDTLYGLVYKLMNQEEKSAEHLRKAIIHFDNLPRTAIDDYRIRSGLSLTLALFGDFEKAIEHGKITLKMVPIYKDIFICPIVESIFAQVLTLAGKYDEALDVIERVLGRRLQHTLPLFTNNPIFDPLANHPRMIELKKQYAYQYPKED